MKKATSVVFLLAMWLVCTAQFPMKRIKVEEENGTPSEHFWKLKVPNTSLTDNSDGTVSLGFYTKDEADDRYVEITGDTMTGALGIPSLTIDETEIWAESGEEQTTIDAITDASSSKPYLIHLPSGIVTGPITMADNISLKGAGAYATKITSTSNPTVRLADNVTLSNMEIEGVGSGVRALYPPAGGGTFYVRDCILDGDWDCFYSDAGANAVLGYFYDCTGITRFDGFTTGTATNTKLYLYNCTVSLTNPSLEASYGLLRSFFNGGGIWMYGGRLYASIDNGEDVAGVKNVDAYLEGVEIDITNAGAGDADGILAASATRTANVHGGSITTSSGSGTATDLNDGAGAINIYGTRFDTQSGTIGGYGWDESAGALAVGDGDDYLQVFISNDVPVLKIIGDYALMLDSDDENIIKLSLSKGANEYLHIIQHKADNYSLFQASDPIWFAPSGDGTDYLIMQTVGDVPEITTGGSCDLKLTSSSGEINLDDENLTTTGNITIDSDTGGLIIGENQDATFKWNNTINDVELTDDLRLTNASGTGLELYDSDDTSSIKLHYQASARYPFGIWYSDDGIAFDSLPLMYSDKTNVGFMKGDVIIRNNLTDGTNSLTIANAKAAYDHSEDNTQGHDDYLRNDISDLSLGEISAAGGFATGDDIYSISDNQDSLGKTGYRFKDLKLAGVLTDDTASVSVANIYQATGDTLTGVHDMGGTTSFELPNDAAPTTDATGEIALDTTITDHQPLWQYYDGGENMSIIAIDTAQLPALDNEIIAYDAATDKFVLEAAGAASDTNALKVHSWNGAATLPIAPGDVNKAAVYKDDDAVIDILGATFDDSTAEYRMVTFNVAPDVDTSGSVTFVVKGYPVTAATDDIVMCVTWHEVGDGENWDGALTTETATASTQSGTQDVIDVITWTETFANLGWVANDFIEFYVCRDADNASDDLAGDWVLLQIDIYYARS